MNVNSGGNHTHNHSLLAGVSAATAGVLVTFVLVLLAWHASGAAGSEAVRVIVWTVAAFVVVAALYGVAFLGLRLRHHAAHPETLVRRAVTAEVIPAQVEAPASPALPAPVRAALPPGVRLLPRDPDEAIEAIRAWSGRSEQR